MKRTLYGDDGTGGLVACTKKLDRRKVSWAQLGATVGVIFTILGATYLKVDWSSAEDRKKIESRCDSNAKQIQTFSINHAVLVEKVDEITKKIEKAETERKSDVHVLHRRITEFDNKLDRILKEVKK